MQRNTQIKAIIAFALIVGCVSALPAGKTNQRGAGTGAAPLSLVPIKGQPQLQQPQPQQQQPLQLAPPSKGQLNQVSPLFASRPPIAPAAQIQQQQQQQEPEVQQQQQQQEVEPSGAAQDSAPAIAAPALLAPAEEAEPRPEPYAFNYAFDASDASSSGSSARSESQDTNGVVTGFYTLRGDDGRDRRVEYTADASGFKAVITTNELGTAPANPADVQMQAQSPSDGQLREAESATQAARARAAAAPQLHQSHQSPVQQQVQQQFASSSTNKASLQRLSPSKTAGIRQLNLARENSKLAPSSAARLNQEQIQLQEPFEQIRQTELNARTKRKSRHAPFYLFSI